MSRLCRLCVLCGLCASVVLLSPLLAGEPSTPQNEREWCEALAPKYHAELGDKRPLWDGSRCDLITETHAIEVDWAPKWPEGVGQALYYGIVLERKPAVLLLVKDPERERRYLLRCQAVCARYEIRLWVEQVE